MRLHLAFLAAVSKKKSAFHIIVISLDPLTEFIYQWQIYNTILC